MALYDRLEAELIAARKRRDQLALVTLGLFKSELVKATKEPGAPVSIDDALVVRVAGKEVKRRDEAAQAFRAAGREDPARQEEAEAELLKCFMPAQLSNPELEAEVRAVIAEVGPGGPQAFGQVMKVASARLAGRADGGQIAAMARKLLG